LGEQHGYRIAIDATPLSVRTGGIRRYTEELARALAGLYPGDEYALISDQPFETSLPLRRGERPGLLGRRWWLYGVQREMSRLGSQVFHGTDFAVPYLPLRPSVMTLHDLSPWRTGLTGASDRVRRRTPVLLRLRLATMVITPSAAVRNEAISMFDLPPQVVVSIPESGFPGSFRKNAIPMTRSHPYFLFVGSLEPRKNIPSLVAAWRELRDEADLILIGRGSPRATIVDPEPGLECLENVPDEDLPGWYAGAVAFVYPSIYEGFGLPVLEAMGCGAPVITSCDRAISEVANGAAVQVEAGDVRGLREAMSAALHDGFREQWRERGLRRAAEFSWERTARATREVYGEAMRRFHR
jgi:glycosyltransferase involved in cell wall biosynthesis